MTEVEELAERLCLAAGMIMENVVNLAILKDRLTLPDRVSRIGAAGRDITALTDAARALLERDKQQPEA